MTTKQWIMIGTIAIMITFNNAAWRDELNPAATASLTQSGNAGTADPDEAGYRKEASAASDNLLGALGVASDKELYDALYNGETLADIAGSRGKDVNDVIRLQVAQLAGQLDQRAASGSISPSVYEAQKQELYDIVARSTYGA